jgi:choline-sulfatase
MVTFLDEQIGIVLRALEESRQLDNTRIVYTTDHGDMLGDHGLWWKSVLYDGAAGIPLLLAGPSVPQRKAVNTPVSLVDVFPTIMQGTGAGFAPEDADLPGRSLLDLAHEPDNATRTVFAEYHASHSSSGSYLLRRGRYKYAYYVGYPPQLFDLQADPDEAHDLAAAPAYAAVVDEFERELRAMLDPEAVDAAAKADQRRRIDAAGGLAAVLAGGAKFNHTPAPEQFAVAAAAEGSAS